jgi:hypothetical protein
MEAGMTTTLTEIPLRSDLPRFAEVVELGGAQYRFEFSWNTRDSRWYVSVLTSAGARIVMGQPIVADFPLFERFADSRLPTTGLLWARNVSGDGLEPGQYDLGTKLKLFLVEEG